MPTDTKLNQLIINQLTQEQYDEAKAAGTLSDTELYITDSDDDAQVKSNLSQIIDDSTTKYPSNKAVKDESSRITTLMDTKFSNCITEIPQDIKLELNNNNTIVLKKGSIVYVPNGANFDKVTITQDVSDSADSNRETMLFYRAGQSVLEAMPVDYCFSGPTAPTSFLGGNYAVWYDTTNNIIKLTGNGGTSWNTGYCFPVCLAHETTTTYSISQIFNGFGYLGSTVYVLPGVKGFIPNGRNADGSLKSIKIVQNSVKIMTMASYMAGRKHCPLEIFFNNELSGMQVDSNQWGVVATLRDLPRDKLYAAYYCLEDNFVHYFNNTGVEGIDKCLFAATFAVGDDNKITSFTPKTVFHALDYNDKSTISGWSMPSDRYINLTLGADGTTYVAPANGYFYVKKDFAASGQYIWFKLYNSTDTVMDITFWGSNNGFIGGFISVSKGSKVGIHYNARGSTLSFRFIYAEGEPYNPVSSSGVIVDTGGVKEPKPGDFTPVA